VKPPSGLHAGRASEAVPSTSGRERILARVREAVATRARASHPGNLEDMAAPIGLTIDVAGFSEMLGRSGGEVVRLATMEEARGWLTTFTGAWSTATVSPMVPEALRPALDAASPETANLGVSVALAAAAATGTLLLPSGEGRRTQLLAPVHLVWVEERTVFGSFGRALAHLRASEEPLPATIGLHSGPSKSADIGRIIVTGVHGPGRLVAAVTGFALR
jgi:L-lactate dehydrogenase complex protein LldG